MGWCGPGTCGNGWRRSAKAKPNGEEVPLSPRSIRDLALATLVSSLTVPSRPSPSPIKIAHRRLVGFAAQEVAVAVGIALGVKGCSFEGHAHERAVQERHGWPEHPRDRTVVDHERRPHQQSIDAVEGVVRVEERGAKLTHRLVGASVDDAPAEYV